MRVNKLTTVMYTVYLNDFIWVDALCINQSDLAERAIQVALMGSLYTAAEEVLIWLGPEHEYFPDFSMAISGFHPALSGHELGHKEILSNLQLQTGESTLGLLQQDSISSNLKGMVKFMSSCTWFSRVWTMQEHLLARRTVWMCGSHEFWGNVWLDWIEKLEYHGLLAMTTAKIAEDAKQAGYSSSLCESYKGVKIRRYALQQNKPHPLADCFKTKDSDFFGQLWLLLCEYRKLYCQDSQDHVYATLGLLSHSFKDFPNHIKPDYEILPGKLFTQVTKLILDHSSRLDTLSLSRGDKEESRMSNLPSWVPDYSSEFDRIHTRIGASTDAAKGMIGLHHEVSQTHLTCSGTIGMNVKEVFTTKNNAWSLEDWEACLRFAGCDSLNDTTCGTLETLWRTLIQDCIMTRNSIECPAPLEYGSYFLDSLVLLLDIENIQDSSYHVENSNASLGSQQAATKASSSNNPHSSLIADLPRAKRYLLGMKSIQHPPPPPSVENSFASTAIEMTRTELIDFISRGTKYATLCIKNSSGRRLFKTENGKLGYGPYHIKPGDQVWAVHTSRMPFVLRPTGVMDEFEFVGDCYMHDFMDGEMLESSPGVKREVRRIALV